VGKIEYGHNYNHNYRFICLDGITATAIAKEKAQAI
jgi:hypothetical protein